MRELDLERAGELPLVISRERVTSYLARINELRVRLEQQNDVGEVKRRLRLIVRIGSHALKRYHDGADASVLEQAIQDMLTAANPRL